MVRELNLLYRNGNKDSLIRALSDLILQLKTEPQNYCALAANFLTDAIAKPAYQEQVNPAALTEPDAVSSEFLKSWEDILNLQLYIDTDIYGTLDPEPIKAECVLESPDTIEHEDATEIYAQSWSEIAKSMANLPDDVFTRLWSTTEVAKILDCTSSMLRRARKESRLPLKVKDLIVDCVSHDGRKSLWFVRPS
jgi:hypothetical protein